MLFQDDMTVVTEFIPQSEVQRDISVVCGNLLHLILRIAYRALIELIGPLGELYDAGIVELIKELCL